MDVAPHFRPPRASLEVSVLPDGVPWRIEGRTLYVRLGARLPDVCIFTGQATTPDQRVETGLTWTPRWFAIAWVVATLPALLAYSFFRRTGRIEFGLGDAGRKRRRRATMISVGIVAVLVAMLAAAAVSQPAPIFGGLLLALVALLVAASRSRVFRLIKIDRTYMRIALTEPAAQAFARISAERP